MSGSVIEKLKKTLETTAKGSRTYKTIEAQIAALEKQAQTLVVAKPNPPEKPVRFFQAIGTIKAIVSVEENDGKQVLFGAIGAEKFRLKMRRKKAETFLKYYKPGTSIYLRVYPGLFIVPKQPPDLQFQVVAWKTELPEDWQENQFTLRGLWQFIPQNRGPVIAIKRNWMEKDQRDKLIASGEKFKGVYVPLIWRDCKVSPYRFALGATEQPDKFFVEVSAKFLVDRRTFAFQSLLSEPTLDAPRYLMSLAQIERKKAKKPAQKSNVQKPTLKKAV